MIKSNKIKEVTILPEMIAIARAKAEEMGKINNSILIGEGSLAGFLGEEIVKYYLVTHGVINGKNTYEYDFTFNDMKIEVKTKQTTVKPMSHYECSVASYNPNQQCDYYVFVRVHQDLDKAWILGFIGKEEYFKKAVYMRKGDLDPSNDFTVKANCYNLKISELDNIKEL